MFVTTVPYLSLPWSREEQSPVGRTEVPPLVSQETPVSKGVTRCPPLTRWSGWRHESTRGSRFQSNMASAWKRTLSPVVHSRSGPPGNRPAGDKTMGETRSPYQGKGALGVGTSL